MSSGGTVVIADDDPDIRALIALSVTRAGAVVAADVSTGGAALDAIRRCVPDLAILDVSMPGMTGLQVCRAVRADPATSDVRVLVLSAAVDAAAVAEGGAAGADAYELKPFSPRTLAERVRELVRPRPPRATGSESATRFVAPEE
ncbi:response regulator [Pseudonocardia lacus]|uniref:response regulator n=1 Tax=Pseudonocardia lacus TaxID=2835865 RepID=UPI001BDD5413|nr:response regulator [Pseudonocardia lacus]